MKKIRYTISSAILFLALCGGARASFAADYYVSPTGAATWANCGAPAKNGTAACSLSTANANVQAGDIVNLRGGTYSTPIIPEQSGSAGALIIYQAYTEEEPIITVSSDRGFSISGNKDYIKIDGIYFLDCLAFGQIANGSDYNEITNSTFSTSGYVNANKGIYVWNASSGSPSTNNWIHHNTFGRNLMNAGCEDEGGQLFLGVYCTGCGNADNNNTVEHNVFYSGGHHLMEIYSKYNVIRNNVFHNEGYYDQIGCAWGPSPRNNKYGNRNVALYDGNNNEGMYNLFEANRTGHAAFTVDGAQEGNLTVTSPKNIIRYNYSYYSETFGIAFKIGTGSYGRNNRVYNNTLYYNGQDSQIYPNGWTGYGDMDWRGGIGCTNTLGTDTSNIIKNNLIYQSYSNRDVMNIANYSCVGRITDINNFKTSDGDPLFTNTDVSDPTSLTNPVLALQAESPAINGGAPLTTAKNIGESSISLTVADALYFHDGTWGSAIANQEADWIAIGTVSNIAQISSIDYASNAITLSSPMSWPSDAPVWLYKKSDSAQVLFGSAPDYGAYEYAGDTTFPAAPSGLSVI